MSEQKQVTLLFPAARRRLELIGAYKSAFLDRDYSVRTVATDVNPNDPVSYFTDASYYLPDGKQQGFAAQLLEICRREKVDLLIPWQDVDIQAIADNVDGFAKTGTRVLIPPSQSVAACIDKRVTIRLMEECGLKVPASYDSAADVIFPAIVKPIDGAGSVNVYRCENQDELNVFLNRIKPQVPLLQQFIEGTEFTVDCFCDAEGNLISACPRRRAKIRGGEVLTSVVQLDEKLREIACTISSAIKLVGPFNYQVIRTESGEDFFIEINPRYSGGAPLSIKAGWEAPSWTVDLFEGKTPKSTKALRDGLHMMRYHSAIYLHEEDIRFSHDT